MYRLGEPAAPNGNVVALHSMYICNFLGNGHQLFVPKSLWSEKQGKSIRGGTNLRREFGHWLSNGVVGAPCHTTWRWSCRRAESDHRTGPKKAQRCDRPPPSHGKLQSLSRIYSTSESWRGRRLDEKEKKWRCLLGITFPASRRATHLFLVGVGNALI